VLLHDDTLEADAIIMLKSLSLLREGRQESMQPPKVLFWVSMYARTVWMLFIIDLPLMQVRGGDPWNAVDMRSYRR
jgi:hypothetical protein